MTIATGIRGHLIATAFLDSAVGTRGAALGGGARTSLKTLRLQPAFGPASSVRSIFEAGAVPLTTSMGFDPPAGVETIASALAATVQRDGRAVALLVSPWGEPFDPLWRTAVTEATRRGAAWCLHFDGSRLRIVDADRPYARRFVEFDLDLVLDDERLFAALWRTASAEALTASASDPCSLHALVLGSDRHASGVCRSLRDGVVSASSDVLAALLATRRAGRQPPPLVDGFEQALTIVYRLLFLLFAEARQLVPLWHPVYRDAYSVEALRELAERSGRAPGLWDTLRAMARLAHAGCAAGDLRVTPFNGRLFSPARTPLAERRGLDDEAARRAVMALSTRPAPDRGGRERITYRDLGVEQLGAVYETLLDYEPRVTSEPRAARGGPRVHVSLETGSGVRKATGTFYTPQPIADYLVRRTLGPLVRDASCDDVLRLRIVDPAMGSGAFLVSACRYLAYAYEQALVREGRCHAIDLDDDARAGIRRTIAERCLYGVDVNPMAVQLARLSLWLATLASDRPLSFLDHRLQVGDSLLGAWLTNLRHGPGVSRGGARSDLPLFEGDLVGRALRDALPVRFSLESTPNDSLEQVRAKERAFAAATAPGAPLSRWKRIANVWCAAWLLPPDQAPPSPAFGELSDFLLTGRCQLPPATAARYVAAADAAAAMRRFFHWELEYPEVFFDADGSRLPAGGFDAVLGNPPWDMMRADDGPAERRSAARDDVSRIVRFTRDASVYASKSTGHANRYQLFVERALALTRSGGRIGLVLPSGLAIDHGSAELRRTLFRRADVDAIVGVDNRRGVFPIHRSVRFLLVTASAGRATDAISARFDLDDPGVLESIGEEPARLSPWFSVRLSPALLERLSGHDVTVPLVRDPIDLRLLERAAALFPPLGSGAGWAARFGRELNATDDRGVFRPAGTARSDRDRSLPVVEGKHLEPFRVSLADARHAVARSDAKRLLADERYDRPRLAYRDVASATNRVTLIAAVLPRACVSTHTVFCLRSALPGRAQQFLCGLFNSFVVNFFVRMRVSTHVTTAIVERLPVPTEEMAPGAFREIAWHARVLARAHDREAFARLNACVASLYQLTIDEFEHVLKTFPLVEEKERDAALSRFVSTQR
jgi:hypothetical protein